jgi:hypothetical protein
MMIKTKLLAALIAPAALLTAPEVIAESTSYTRTDGGCTSYQYEGEPVWEIGCPGFARWSVFISASDHGSASAYAVDGSERSDFMSPPSRGLFGGFGDVIEWRTDGGVAFATIHRYVHDTPTPDGNSGPEFHTLIVTALRPMEAEIACTVAYVDASALSGANEIAQAAADRLARGWSCGTDPVWFNTANPNVNRWANANGH